MWLKRIRTASLSTIAVVVVTLFAAAVEVYLLQILEYHEATAIGLLMVTPLFGLSVSLPWFRGDRTPSSLLLILLGLPISIVMFITGLSALRKYL